MIRGLGQPVWQNVLDLWTIQETLVELAPALLIDPRGWLRRKV